MSQSSKKQAKRHVQMVAHEGVGADIDPCLGKVRFATEEEAKEQSSFRPYLCAWGEPHWHTSAHGFKGARKGR